MKMKYKFEHRFFAECFCGNRIQASVLGFQSNFQEVNFNNQECYMCHRLFKKIICITESINLTPNNNV